MPKISAYLDFRVYLLYDWMVTMRFSLLTVLLLLLAACSDTSRSSTMSPEPIGQFRLGFAEVVAPNPQKLLDSRNATGEEWARLVDEAVEERFSRFDGEQLFHLGIVVDAYSLPPAMLPGRSALAVRVTVWEDATQAKLNSEPNMISVVRVFEEARDLERTEEMALLARDVAGALEDWLRSRQRDAGWFGAIPEPVVDAEEQSSLMGDIADAG